MDFIFLLLAKRSIISSSSSFLINLESFWLRHSISYTDFNRVTNDIISLSDVKRRSLAVGIRFLSLWIILLTFDETSLYGSKMSSMHRLKR